MKLSILSEDAVKHVYRGIPVYLEKPGGRDLARLTEAEIINLIQNLVNNYTITHMPDGLHVATNIGYALTYASTEMVTCNSDLSKCELKREMAAADMQGIQMVGAIFIIDAGDIRYGEDAAAKRDLGFGGPARGLFAGSGDTKSMKIPFSQIPKLKLVDLRIYPSTQYHGAGARNFYSLAKMGANRIAKELIDIPYWPDVINNMDRNRDFEFSEKPDYDDPQYELISKK